MQQRNFIARQRRALNTILKDCQELSQRCCEMLNDYSELIDGLKEICSEDALRAADEEQTLITKLIQDCDRYYTVAISENAGIQAASEVANVEVDELISLTANLALPE